MSENLYGYVRVSTKEQNLDRQILALREFGVPEKQILQEKKSGKDFERPVYLHIAVNNGRWCGAKRPQCGVAAILILQNLMPRKALYMSSA